MFAVAFYLCIPDHKFKQTIYSELEAYIGDFEVIRYTATAVVQRYNFQ